MRTGFTLLELVFVIVIFGIMSKFGADILYKIYENYVFSNTTNRLLNQSEAAVKQIANRLQYRIKDSTIARDDFSSVNIEPIGSNTGNELVLEWIGTDIDGWRGTSSTTPDWSGFIDLDPAVSSATSLRSPGTSALVDTDLAIFFIGSDVDLDGNGFGWDGNAIGTQTSTSMHRVTVAANTITSSLSAPDNNFSGVDVYEYYQLSKSAFAVSLEPDNDPDYPSNNLWFYHDYQPWEGDDIGTPGTYTKSLIMENVSSFKFTSMGDIMIIQVCVTDKDITGVGGYSICKEKVVF